MGFEGAVNMARDMYNAIYSPLMKLAKDDIREVDSTANTNGNGKVVKSRSEEIISKVSQPVKETTAPVAQPAKETTAPVSQPVKETTAPVSQPAKETAAPVAQPAKETTAPVSQPAKETTAPVSQPVKETAAPVAQPAKETAAPVAQPVKETTAPVAQPAKETTAPVAQSAEEIASYIQERTEEITSLIQQRCLWQFHSRAWDREENINGVLNKATQILTGEKVVLETLIDKAFYADAKLLVVDLQSKFQWLTKMDNVQKKAVLESVKNRLIDIAITHSLNGELHHSLY
jgi:V-containing nitrogenase delta subunit